MFGLNITELLVGVLVFIGALTGAYFYGHSNGVDSERVVWQAKEIKATQEADKALADAQDKVNSLQAQYANNLAVISGNYQQELKNVSATKDRTIAALRAGAIRLRDPGTNYTLSPNPLSGSTATASRCDGKATGRLSDELKIFLVDEASRANSIVNQLTECQAIIVKDRQVCGLP